MSHETVGDTRPFFTVIVPTYNQDRYLGSALDSLIAQTDSDWEAVIVNDGSTDDTGRIIETYAANDTRFRPMHKPNGGVASALNEGLRQARGEWICWLSSDDMFEPEKLEINRQWIVNYPDCRFFFSYFKLLREATGELSERGLWGPLPRPALQIPGLFRWNFVSGITICVYRDAWRQAGFFDESLRYGQDYDMWLRLMSLFPATFIPEWTVISRNHAGQGSETFPQACLYDSAKAAVNHLNHHSFAELFPLLDLTQRLTAERALRGALKVACNPGALIYTLGPHPALLLRILEWILEDDRRQPAVATRLKSIAQRRLHRAARRASDPDFRAMCLLTAAVAETPSARFAYRTIDPADIGERRTHVLQAMGTVDRPLEEYLRRFAGRVMPHVPPSEQRIETVFRNLFGPLASADSVAAGWTIGDLSSNDKLFSIQLTGYMRAVVGRASNFIARCISTWLPAVVMKCYRRIMAAVAQR